MKHSFIRVAVAVFGLGLLLPAHAAVETYRIQPAHSSVNFGVRHFFTKVPGAFARFEGTITVDRDNLENSSTEAKIEVTSVNTNEPKRDAKLQEGDFFLTEKFPAITFKSSSWKKTAADTYDVAGDLTIKDVTKPVVLKTKALGFGPGARGAQLAGFEAAATIDRRDFGIAWGQGIVGNEVDIVVNIESVKQ